MRFWKKFAAQDKWKLSSREKNERLRNSERSLLKDAVSTQWIDLVKGIPPYAKQRRVFHL